MPPVFHVTSPDKPDLILDGHNLDEIIRKLGSFGLTEADIDMSWLETQYLNAYPSDAAYIDKASTQAKTEQIVEQPEDGNGFENQEVNKNLSLDCQAALKSLRQRRKANKIDNQNLAEIRDILEQALTDDVFNRADFIRSISGKFAFVNTSSEAFAQRKNLEKALER